MVRLNSKKVSVSFMIDHTEIDKTCVSSISKKLNTEETRKVVVVSFPTNKLLLLEQRCRKKHSRFWNVNTIVQQKTLLKFVKICG